IDPDLSRPQLCSKRAGNCVDRTFSSRVDCRLGLSRACNRTYVNDAATLLPEVLYRFLGGENRTQHVYVELAMELLLGDLRQRYELVNAGIVHQHVKSSEGLFGFG